MSSDIIDQANELVEHRLQLAIQKHRIDQNAVSAEHCSECGEDIPEAPGCHAWLPNVRQLPGIFRAHD